MHQLVKSLDYAKNILFRNRVYTYEIEELNDKDSTLMIYAIKVSGLLTEFMKEYPDHRAVFVFKRVTTKCAEGRVFKGATDIITSKDTPRNYPSLAEWFLERKFFNAKEPKLPLFTYTTLE